MENKIRIVPNYYDFSKLDNVKETRIYPVGWVSPLIVEYGIGYHGELLSYYWRVKGTKHTFVIPIIRMDYLTEGDYRNHFAEALESFREDYLEWASQEFYAPWMMEYKEMYEKYITI
jgi:hypothetical protein